MNVATLDEIERELRDPASELLQAIGKSILSYTVALFGVTASRGTETLRLAGTGTLSFARRDAFGILTAAHVWEEVLKNSNKVGITMTANITHSFLIDTDAIRPTVMRARTWNEIGPDVAFLQIPSESVGSIEAFHVFEDLQKPPKVLGLDALECWIAMGTPAEFGTIRQNHATVEINANFVGDVEYKKEEFDYYNFRAETSLPGVPKSFGGFSGGGLWRALVFPSPETGKVDWVQRLKGVIFYEFPVEHDGRVIRSHGPNTIESLMRQLNAAAAPE